MSYRADGVSMLLSSDWFYPAWHICGLSSLPSVRQQIRTGCREIVAGFMGGEDSYWEVEFSDARQQMTGRYLLDCFVHCQGEERDIGLLRQLLIDAEREVEVVCDEALVSSLLALLVSDYSTDAKIRDGIPVNVFAAVSSEVDASGGMQDVKSMAAEASSEWDLWLAKIVGDVPQLLINAAQDIYDASEGFFRSWAAIQSKLQVNERKLLAMWLNKWGLLLADKVAIRADELS